MANWESKKFLTDYKLLVAANKIEKVRLDNNFQTDEEVSADDMLEIVHRLLVKKYKQIPCKKEIQTMPIYFF